MVIYQDNAGHMTKMASMPIYGKTLDQEQHGLILMKICMKHQRSKPYIFCSNCNLWVTLTYFMARSNFST